MGVNFSLDNLWGTGESSAGTNKFFTPMWSDRTENAYSDFFKKDGWKKPGEWLNPGGVMANPAQQLADPGDFFTTGEHENWVKKGKVSDRTLSSAAIAALFYGGGSALSGMGGSSVGGSSGSMGMGSDAASLAAAESGASFGGLGTSGSMGMGSDAASLAFAENGAGGGWWSSIMDWLGGGGQGLMSDQGALSSLLGQGGQSFSASDPTSWQHQLGGQAAQAGETQQMTELINALAASRASQPKAPEVKRKRANVGEGGYSLLGDLGTLSTPVDMEALRLLSTGG